MAVAAAGCGNIRLHDESRSKLATETSATYAQADVPGILEVERKNLDVLLAESLKASRENHQLQLDFALLSIAADQTPMAGTLAQLPGTLKSLGFREKEGIAHLRDFVLSLSEPALSSRELALFDSLIRQQTMIAPPPCLAGQTLPPLEEWGAGLAAELRAQAKPLYDNYAKVCLEANAKVQPSGGLMSEAAAKLEAELQAKKNNEDSLTTKKQELADARKAYKSATEPSKAAFKGCAQQEAGLVEEAKAKLVNLQNAAAAADKLDLSATNDERIKGLLVLLESAAGGKVEAGNEELAKAARVAQELPSLWGDMCELIVSSKTPPVGNLLLALRHATLLTEFAQEQEALAEARLTLLRQKQKLLGDEAKEWLRFVDAVCSFAAASADRTPPGASCSTFVASEDGKTCQINGLAFPGECALGRPWSEHLRARGKPRATRELYKALLAYQRAFALRARASDIDFRLIDTYHRETLAQKRLAIHDWDNLVGSAVGQVDAYFKAGLKPAEIADLIVKALGFTAIAIGAAQ